MTTSASRALGGMLLGLLLLMSPRQVAAQKLEKMRVGYNAITGSNSALWISKEAGFTAKNGLDVDFIYIESGSRITQAMVAGDLRLGNTGSGPSLQAHARGADTVLILSVMPTLPFQVVARPDIKRPEDLRGKKLAISTFGSTTDFAARYFLEKTGLTAGLFSRAAANPRGWRRSNREPWTRRSSALLRCWSPSSSGSTSSRISSTWVITTTSAPSPRLARSSTATATRSGDSFALMSKGFTISKPTPTRAKKSWRAI